MLRARVMKSHGRSLNDTFGGFHCGKARVALTLPNLVRECAHAFIVIFLKVEPWHQGLRDSQFSGVACEITPRAAGSHISVIQNSHFIVETWNRGH